MKLVVIFILTAVEFVHPMPPISAGGGRLPAMKADLPDKNGSGSAVAISGDEFAAATAVSGKNAAVAVAGRDFATAGATGDDGPVTNTNTKMGQFNTGGENDSVGKILNGGKKSKPKEELGSDEEDPDEPVVANSGSSGKEGGDAEGQGKGDIDSDSDSDTDGEEQD